MIEILLIDDHNIVIEGITSFFNGDPDIEIKDTATDGLLGYKKCMNDHYDIIVTDLNMPKMSGLELIEKIKADFPTIKVIALTTYYHENILKELTQLNVEGIVVKTLGMKELRKAILTVSSGNIYSSSIPEANQQTSYDLNQWDDFIKTYELTTREVEILVCVCNGETSNAIAEKLFISKETVGTHRKNIMKKTNSHSIIDLYKLALKSNLLD